MRGHPPPEGYREADWHQFKLDALALLHPQHGYAAALIAAGWDTLSLFGLHPTRPYRRVSHMGLAACLHGAELLEIAPDAIGLRHRTGTTGGSLTRFYRTTVQPGAVPAWSFQPDDQPEENQMAYEEDAFLDPDAYQSDPMAFLRYHVEELFSRGTNPHIPAGSFTRRVGRDLVITDLSQGALCDAYTSRIGWMLTTGVAGEVPLRVWSPTRAKQIPKPDNRDWKTAFWCQLALQIEGEVIRLVWESSQGASWKGYREVMLMLATSKHAPQLPLIKHTGHTPTMVPVFEIISFEDRPSCLPTDPEKYEKGERTNQGNGGYRERQVQRGGGPSWDAPARSQSAGGSLPDDDIPF
jgi:hypothetical protein